MAKEINLVPDIKNEFIKTLKFRNLVFFISIVVAAGSLIVMLVFLSISGGQDGFIAAKKATIDALEEKINEYSDLNDFLTIRDQLGNLTKITENKVMGSRTFNILSALVPRGKDHVDISELTVNLTEDSPSFTFEAQADAAKKEEGGTDIDYTVLDSFKKSMPYMRYDYGEYVDKDDKPIPAYCIIETDSDGATLRDTTAMNGQIKGYYAYWLIDGEGCNPALEEEEETNENEEEKEENNKLQTNNSSLLNQLSNNTTNSTNATNSIEKLKAKTGYDNIEEYEGQYVVKIWRTPQFDTWYKQNPGENDPYIGLDGSIHNIPHFNSSCITYSGVENESTKEITWTAENSSCKLVPDDEEGNPGIKISESSNGRDSNDSLVLRFNATITLAPEVFNFNNHHMIALSPNGRYNVTDSYSQIQSMFTERAADCEKDDTICINTPTSDPEQTKNQNNSDSESESNEEE